MATYSSVDECDKCDDLFCHHRNATDDERNNMLICGLCEVGERAEGKCKECDEYLCDGCIIRHIKLKVTTDHHIIPLDDFQELRDSDVIQLRQRTYSLRATKDQSDETICRKHRGEARRFYCNDCKVTICRDCILTSHKSHISVDIDDAAEDIRQDLLRVVGDLKIRKLNLTQDREVLDEYKRQVDGQFGKMSDMFRLIYQERSTFLNDSYSQINQKLKELQESEYFRIQELEAELESQVESSDSVIRSSEKSILSTPSLNILETKAKLKSDLINHLFDFENGSQLGKLEFFIIKNQTHVTNSSENFIGDVSVTVSKLPIHDPSPSIIHELKVKKECIFSIWESRNNRPSIRGIAEAEGAMWVATSRSLVKIGMDGFKRTNVQLTANSDIVSIATGPGGKLLVGFNRGNVIKVFFKDVWSNFVTTADSISSISTSRDTQRVFVSIASHRGDSQKVVVYGADGKMKQHIILPYELRMAKTSISCLTTNPAGNICLCDSNKSRVLFMNKNVEIMNEYVGPEGKLSPRAVAFDSLGHALVADSNRNNVQFLTEDGTFLLNLLGKEDFRDIGSPVALAVDHKDRLWVGTDMGSVCCYSY